MRRLLLPPFASSLSRCLLLWAAGMPCRGSLMHVCGTVNISAFENEDSERGGGIEWKEKKREIIEMI